MRRLRHRLVYSSVIAALALFAVLGGTGAAEPIADSAASLGNTVKRALGIGKKANRTAKKALRTARRARAAANQALTQGGPPGPKGASGPPGPAGTARAYAYVRPDGTLDPSRTKNVNGVRPTCADPCASVPPPGPSDIDCFDLPFTPSSAVASAEFLFDATVVVGVAPLESYGPVLLCPPGYQDARAATMRSHSPSPSVGFFIVFN